MGVDLILSGERSWHCNAGWESASSGEDQLNRLLQAQIHGMNVTLRYELGAWGNYKCVTGFDIATP